MDFLFFELSRECLGRRFVTQAFHETGAELALRHRKMRWRKLAQIRTLFNITAYCFVAIFNRAFFVWRLRMAEKYRRIDEVGKFDVFLERNIIVDSQAFNRIRAKQFVNRMIDRGGIAIHEITQERVPSFAFHDH